jgi:hypothetical protein
MDAAGADGYIERDRIFWYIYGTVGPLLDSEYLRWSGTITSSR